MKSSAKKSAAPSAAPPSMPLWTRTALGVAMLLGWVTGLGAVAGWLPLPGVRIDDAATLAVPTQLAEALATGWIAWAAQVGAAAMVAGATAWVTLQQRAPDEARDAAWLAPLLLGALCWADRPSTAVAIALTPVAMVLAERARGTAALVALVGALLLHPAGWPAAVGVGVLVVLRRGWRQEFPPLFAATALVAAGVLGWQLLAGVPSWSADGAWHAVRGTLTSAVAGLDATVSSPVTALLWLLRAALFAAAVRLAPDAGWRALAVAALVGGMLLSPTHAWDTLGLLIPLLAAGGARVQQRVLGGNPVALVLAAVVWTVVVLQIS